MQFNLRKLKNGIRVLTVPMPSLTSATLTIWVKTGSRNEEERVGGISHFLEHMVFKGSKKRPTAKEISETVDSIGAEFNAATSKDWTNFYIKSRTANLELAMDVLADMVVNPILDPAEIEREKGTIIQEIAMYEDTPTMHIGDIFEELIFEGNPLGRDTAGKVESVKRIKKDDFVSYRKMHYVPENILITVAGGITENTTLKLVERYFQKLQITNDKLQISEEFQNRQTKPKFKLQTKKSEQAHLVLGFLGEGRLYKERFSQSILSAILGAGMSSRLFIEVRERRGLAYSIRASMDRYQEVGYFGTYAGVNVKKAPEAIKVILDQIYGLASGKYEITKKEITKAKEFLKGNLSLALEDTRDVSHFFGDQGLFLPKILTPEEIYKKIDEVSLEGIMSEAKKLFTKERLNLAIIGPYTDGEKFEKLL